MKKIICGLLIALTCISSVQAEVNSLGVAVALVEHNIVEYKFYLYYRDSEKNYHNMRGYINRDGWVTQLSLDNNVILTKDDEPMPGIWYPDEVMYGVYFSVQGHTDKGKYIGYGYVQYDILYKNSSIEVVFNPGQYSKLLNILGEEGDKLYIDGNYVADYSSYYRGFYIYMDLAKSTSNYLYQIYDKDGLLVDAGTLDMYFDVVEEDTQADNILTTITLEGGVVELRKMVSGKYTFDSTVYLDDGTEESAKVFVIDASTGPGLSLWSMDSAQLYSYSRGEFEYLSDVSGYLRLPKTDQKFILVVYGDPDEDFYLHFYPNKELSYNAGGGKG
jgi:hypothetical protein